MFENVLIGLFLLLVIVGIIICLMGIFSPPDKLKPVESD